MSTVATIPSPVLETQRVETGSFRVNGPSRKIGEVPGVLVKNITNDIKPHLLKIKPGQEISFASQHAINLLPKIEKGEKLSPRDMSAVFLFVQEVNSDTLPSDAQDSEIPKFRVGGIADPESPYYIGDEKAREQAAKELQTIQYQIMEHLTGQTKLNVEKWFGFRLADKINLNRWDPRTWFQKETAAQYKDRLTKRFSLSTNYFNDREQLSKQLYSVDWKQATKEQRRTIQDQLHEQMYARYNSDQILDAIKKQPQDVALERLVPAALKSNNPAEKSLAARTENLSEMRNQFLVDAKRIHGMDQIEDYLQLLNIDLSNPNEANIFSNKEITESVIRFYKLNNLEAKEIRQNPHVAVQKYLSRNVCRLASFTGELHRAKLEKFASERDGNVPTKLKEATEIESAFINKFRSRDVVHLLLPHMRASEHPDPISILKSAGMDEKTAKDAIRRAIDDKFMTSKGVGSEATYTISVNDLAGRVSKETLAVAASQNILSFSDVENQIRTHINKNPAYKTEQDRRIGTEKMLEEVRNRYTALDSDAPPNDRIIALRSWDKMALASSLVGGLVTWDEIGTLLSNEDKQVLNSYIAR